MTHRILVIDDDPQTVQMARTWFEGQPYEFLEAPDGETGWQLTLEKRPDLILLDLRMPGLDGITLAGRLKRDPLTRSVPIILLTACRNVETKVEGFAAGVDDYVTKPFAFEEVDARIKSALKKRDVMVHLEGTVRDLTSTNQELEQLLMLDEKTGLYNFREFQRRLKQEWHRAERYEVDLSLVFFDLDHFKQVNDSLGHPAGDQVLREFATLVAGGARANDVSSRYGGEEFAVVLPHTDASMAARVADRIRRAVKEFVFLADEEPTHITVSAGVATYPSSNDIDSVDALIRAADQALYRAKDLGRDRVVRHDKATMGGDDPMPARPGRDFHGAPNSASE